MAKFLISSSEAPIAAKPISWENWANVGSARSGTWPNSSWQQSLHIFKYLVNFKHKDQFSRVFIYGSGVYNGFEECLMYWVQWNTRKAKPYKKSRGVKYPATGLIVKPVLSFRNFETSSNWGILSSLIRIRNFNYSNEIKCKYLNIC